MKTLSYYKQLREDYACIIPKTAPAYELIEALDALIATLQPKEEQPHFLGVSPSTMNVTSSPLAILAVSDVLSCTQISTVILRSGGMVNM